MARVAIGDWDRSRLQARRRSSADRAFWNYLARELPAATARMGPPLSSDEHCLVIFSVIGYCVEKLGRFEDALFLLGEVTQLYGRSGDQVAHKVIDSVSEGCAVIGTRSAHRAAACELLSRLHGPAARTGSAKLRMMVALELYALARLEILERTPSTFIDRTRRLVDLYGDLIRQTQDSRDSELRALVAGARNAKARMHMDLGQEPEARREYSAVARSEPHPDEPPEAADIREIARHALEVLDTVRFPDPEFNTELLKLKRAKNLRGSALPELTEALEYATTRGERLQIHFARAAFWVAQFVPGSLNFDRTGKLVRIARRYHNATSNLVRRNACTGDPLVLVLRNFDFSHTYLTEGAPVMGGAPTHVEVYRVRKTHAVLQRMAERTDAVTIASTHAGALELDDIGRDLGHPTGIRPLYLPGEGWLDHVRTLITVAERIVVWADEKAPSLVLELDTIRELGRAADTVVLLEDTDRDPFTLAFLPEERRRELPPSLTPGDPVLRDFPTVMTADDAVTSDLDRSPFLATVLEPVDRIGNLPVEQRVARLRKRLRTTNRHG